MKTRTLFLKFSILVIIIALTACAKKNNPPSVSDQIFSVDENSISGTLVGKVVASDEDGKVVSYSIKNGNTGNAFSLSEEDGQISVNNEDAVDFETNPVFTLLVEVKDNKNKSSFANMKINLNNIEIPAAGLILYMPFDGNLSDLSTSGNSAIDYTNHSYVSGKRSQAMDFNGSTDYIQLTNTINSQNGLSFSFWIKTRGAMIGENNGSIISKYSKINDTRCFMVYSFGANDTRNDNRLSAAFYEYGFSSGIHDMTKSYLEPSDLLPYPNPGLWTITNPTRLTTGEWTHCVVNVTPTDIETWINNKFCTKKSREFILYNTSDTEPVLIGNNYDIGDGTNNHFNGSIDELRIYNRGLTTAEIKTLFKE
jgi:hypothetical protein